MDQKRLFFGLEIDAPWPATFPEGRLIDESSRHLTLAFLGNIDFDRLKPHLLTLPHPPFKVGRVGTFDQCLFLPQNHPRVVAWHLDWLDATPILNYHKTLHSWLEEVGFPQKEKRPLLSHVTIARSPFQFKQWRESFSPLPAMSGSLHLYESVGNLKYLSVWNLQILPPFSAIEHTGDLAYLVRGESVQELFNHAQVALAFSCPSLLPLLRRDCTPQTLEEVVVLLNEIVSEGDEKVGIPFKAVSFHGEIEKVEGICTWEMIIDV